MRKPRPLVYSLDEVGITRGATSPHINYKDPDYNETTLTIGPEVEQMTDQEIINLYNASNAEQAKPGCAT